MPPRIPLRMTTGYDHQVTAMSRPKIGLGMTAVGSATTNATRLPATSAVTQRRADQVRRVASVDTGGLTEALNQAPGSREKTRGEGDLERVAEEEGHHAQTESRRPGDVDREL